MKGNLYAIVVSAGTKKVTAATLPGEKFAGGGVALRLVVGAGLNITGQVAPEVDRKMLGDTRKISTEEINRLQENQFNNLQKSMNLSGGR